MIHGTQLTAIYQYRVMPKNFEKGRNLLSFFMKINMLKSNFKLMQCVKSNGVVRNMGIVFFAI